MTLAASVLALALFGSASGQQAQEPQLGPAPRVTDPRTLATSVPERFAALAPVDRFTRQAVVDLYNTVYLPALSTAHEWSGSVPGCHAGTTSAAYLEDTMNMVNFFRAMVGLPAALPHVAAKDVKSQEAALMMTANNSLSHFPPTSWACYTIDGAEAAGQSNLALGISGAAAIALYIADPGAGNTALGHRRWILYPRQTEMGSGSTDRSNALWVIGNFGSRPLNPEFVAWPPDGFVPFAVVYPRWSFSVNTGSAVSMAGASVAMTFNGSPVSLTVLPNETGYGDNTLAWEPQALSFTAGAPDQIVTVAVQNVLVGGVSKNYTYTVTVIDPALSPSTPPPTFTDPSLHAGTTIVRTVHFTELRQAVGELRTRHGLAAFAWTDPTLTPGVTVIKAVHLAELRQAIAEVYTAAGVTPPGYTTPVVSAGSTVIAVAHISELRAAVLAIW
jgi:hypothetical protein